MPFTNFRDFWCEEKLAPEDLITLKGMENHSERSIERALPWLLKLLEAETTGVANREQVGTIFDPRIPQYLLKVPCP